MSEPHAMKPITWDIATEVASVGGELIPLRPLVAVDISKHPEIAAIHAISAGQRLRIVMKLPAGACTYDRDAVVLDAGEGLPPLILWADQVIPFVEPTCIDCGRVIESAKFDFCVRCDRRRT